MKTFAAGGLCLLQKADRPFLKTAHFTKALNFKPDIAVITLGTNDTCQNEKRKNWGHQGDLTSDAISLINRLREGNPEHGHTPLFPDSHVPKQKGIKTRAKN